jgi:hypothetical protein
MLAEHTIVDTNRCVPAGSCVSLLEPPGAHGSDSEDDVKSTNPGYPCKCDASWLSCCEVSHHFMLQVELCIWLTQQQLH